MAARLPIPSAFQRILNSRNGALLRQISQPRRTCSIPTTTRTTGFRAYSSSSSAEEPAPPPLLSKLKGDLKTAMRTKDGARLAVLRAILAANLNASKTASPIRTDAQLVGLLRKITRTSQEAAEGFRDAGRADLVEKEEAQIKVLQEYVAGSGLDILDAAAIRGLATKAKEDLAAEGGAVNFGTVMKKLNAPGGPLEGKDYDKMEFPKIVKEVAA